MSFYRRTFQINRIVLLGFFIIATATGICHAGSHQISPVPDLQQIEILDLDTAIAIALAGNPTLAAAEERIRQAKARLNQAQSAYWPRLDATVTGSRVSSSNRSLDERLAQARLFDPTAEIDDPENYFRARLQAVWVLFDGFERKFTNASARLGVDQSRSARLEIRRLLLASVARTYYAAQLALENLAIARADAAFNRRLLIEAKARRRSGTGSLSDELNFQVRVNAARAEEIRTEQVYTATLLSMAAIMGVPEARLPSQIKLARLTTETKTLMEAPDMDPLITFALEHRPAILQGQIEQTQSDQAVHIAKADFYPNINLLASLDGERTEDAGFEGDDFGNTVGVELSYNLFTGGLIRAGIDAAKARLAEKTKDLANTKVQIRAEVQTSRTNLIAAQRQLSLQRDNVELVKQQRDLVEKEYQAGQGTLVRLNEAQRDLNATQGRLALALASVHDAWFKLKTETGQILEAYPLSKP